MARTDDGASATPCAPLPDGNAPHGRSDEDEAWAIGPDGERMWGRHGAAGLLAVDADRGVLMQHRAMWNHFGGTWGIPGGALHRDERPFDGALREACEETAIDPSAVEPLFTSVLDLGYWQYTTLAARVVRPVEVYAADAESAGVAWVAPREVERLTLHPAFAEAWPALLDLAQHRPTLVLDMANVLGSRGDGWWRDPANAAGRLLEGCATLADVGVDAELFDLDAQRVWPDVLAVLEGRARTAPLPRTPSPRLTTARASGSGDDEIVATVRRLRDEAPGRPILVATSDRGLAGRLAEVGVGTVGGGRMRDLIERARAALEMPDAAAPGGRPRAPQPSASAAEGIPGRSDRPHA